MTKQIGITVSDELFGRLQKVKKKFNVSRTCQKGIRRHIEKMELHDRMCKKLRSG